MRGRAAPSGAVDAIGHLRPRFTANEARRRIGRNADAAQLVREFFAPLAQRGLADIQALALLADRLDDHVDVGMRLVGMKRQGKFMHQLRRPLPLQSAESRLAFRKLEIPVLD